jgi:hypothetical protein
MKGHVINNAVPQPNTNILAEKLANIADYIRFLVGILQQTPERHGPIHHFLFRPEEPSFLADSEVWVDDGEECFICKEPLINQAERCIGEPSPEPDNEPRACHPLRLWPCDHIVGDQCFKLWMSNSVNSEAGLCPFCRQPLLVAPQPQSVPQSVMRKIKWYLSSSQLSSVPDHVVHDLRELRVQLTSQPLTSHQLRNLAGPLRMLSLTLFWCGARFGGPLATIFSGLPVVDKIIAVLTILAQPVISIVEMDALSLFLQAIVHGLYFCLGR